MSKIGVGVGEDFPVDDTSNNTTNPGPDGPRDPRRDDDAEYRARREAHRRWREQRHEWKRQWRDEWRARRDEFRERFHDGHDDFGPRGRHGYAAFGYRGYHGYWRGPALWRLIAVAAAIALVVFTLSHIYFILGALVLLALFAAAARHGFDPFDLPPRDYDRRREPPRAPTPPPSGDTTS